MVRQRHCDVRRYPSMAVAKNVHWRFRPNTTRHRNARATNLQAWHGHGYDAKTRAYGDYLPYCMRDQHQDPEERRARKQARIVVEQREVERSASRLYHIERHPLKRCHGKLEM